MTWTEPRGTFSGNGTYQSIYRQSEVAMPCVLAVLVFFSAAVFASVRYTGGTNSMLTALVVSAGITLLLLGAILLTMLRVHHWTVHERGIDISEWPKVAGLGASRSATVRFEEIAAFRNVQSGLESLIEITTRDGRCFRLTQAVTAGSGRFPRPDPGADLGAFAASIRAAAERAGHVLPAMSQGLGFWNSTSGLTVLTILFAISLLISGVVAWALLSGGTPNLRPRSGVGLVILLLLPLGAGYLLRKSLQRRAAVLASLAAPPRA